MSTLSHLGQRGGGGCGQVCWRGHLTGAGVIGEPQGLRNRPQVFCQCDSSGLRGVCPGRPRGATGYASSLGFPMLLPLGPLPFFPDLSEASWLLASVQ